MFLCSDGDQIATKIICYTRSSSLIHQLPTVYPRSTDSTAEDKSSKQYIETLICEKVFVCISTFVLTYNLII